MPDAVDSSIIRAVFLAGRPRSRESVRVGQGGQETGSGKASLLGCALAPGPYEEHVSSTA
jgi:hypothetical protein